MGWMCLLRRLCCGRMPPPPTEPAAEWPDGSEGGASSRGELAIARKVHELACIAGITVSQTTSNDNRTHSLTPDRERRNHHVFSRGMTTAF